MEIIIVREKMSFRHPINYSNCNNLIRDDNGTRKFRDTVLILSVMWEILTSISLMNFRNCYNNTLSKLSKFWSITFDFKFGRNEKKIGFDVTIIYSFKVWLHATICLMVIGTFLQYLRVNK